MGTLCSSCYKRQCQIEQNLIHGEQCSICLEPIENDWFSTSCRHYFHSECVKLWYLNNNKSCPMCRTDQHINTSKIRRNEKITKNGSVHIRQSFMTSYEMDITPGNSFTGAHFPLG